MAGKLSVFLQREEGAATIVEYTIVFPFVIMVVLLLVILGNMTYEKALLESAAERGALYACKVVADPNYANQKIFPKAANLNEIGEVAMTGDKIKTAPYRYLAGFVDPPTVNIKDDIRKLVQGAQFMRNEIDDPVVNVVPGLSYKVEVIVTEDFKMPEMFRFLGTSSFATISATSEMWVNEPAEFIRNADYAVELVQRASDALGVTEKINKIKSSIDFFFNRTGS